MSDIAYVGAGAASAAACYRLSQELPDIDQVVLEKSGGVCGRAATRRHGELVFDYGANYLEDSRSEVNELVTEELDTTGLEEIQEPVWVFDEDGRVSEGREVDETRWTYRDGLTQIAKRLFNEADVDVYRNTHVTWMSREDDGWCLGAEDGSKFDGFDVVVVNPPAPQTAELLRNTDWSHGVRDRIVDAADAVRYRTVYTAVLGYEFEVDVPYYALVNEDKRHAVGWIAREECKPGHVPDDESALVVQANHGWSVRRYDEAEEENAELLADHAAEVLADSRLREPEWSLCHGWRYALPENEVASEPLEAAGQHGLYCTGDWVAGEPRLHAALAHGLETGKALASHPRLLSDS